MVAKDMAGHSTAMACPGKPKLHNKQEEAACDKAVNMPTYPAHCTVSCCQEEVGVTHQDEGVGFPVGRGDLIC